MSKRLIQTSLTTKFYTESRIKRVQRRKCPASRITNNNVCIYNFRLPVDMWLAIMSTSAMYCDKCVRCLFDKQNKKRVEKLKTLENEIKYLLQRPRDELRWSVIKVV